MGKRIVLVLIGVLLTGLPAHAFTHDEVDEYFSPLCRPDEAAPIKKHVMFVNGARMFNWEIRLLKKGDHFNYEFCFDHRSRTDLSRGLPQEFSAQPGEGDPCVLASKQWLHIKTHAVFKRNLKETLSATLQGLQTRRERSDMYALIQPGLKAADYISNHFAELVFPTSYVSLWALGRLQMSQNATVASRLGNTLIRTNKVLAVLSIFLMGTTYFLDDDAPEVKVKDSNGGVITETTLAAREIEEILRDIQDGTGLTPEQIPVIVQDVYLQLRTAIPQAIDLTNLQTGCVQGA